MRLAGSLLAAVCLASCSTGPARQSESAVIGRQVVATFEGIYPHWVLQCDDPAFARQTATFDLTLGPDGRIVGDPVAVNPKDDQGYVTLAASAVRAMRAAEPFPVPPDFGGDTFRPTFNPERACRGR